MGLLNQGVPRRINDCLQAIASLKVAIDVREVVAQRVACDSEILSYFGRGTARRQPAQESCFLICESRGRLGRGRIG